jgi:hypothetical protein|tara:strand:- start:1538 stop:1801 length:264 start_codon:yes stop_codon:yes gene_type:complete
MSKGALEIHEKPILQNITAWNAFQMLRGSRQMGFGSITPIPFSEIMSYCSHVNIDDPTDRQSLAKFVMSLDHTEREHYGNNQSQSQR